ncbi:MAG: SDR family NAD(P)-dependent oxidoreductase [Opitutales bacterium]
MNLQIEGKKVLVTGGTRGIGEAIARVFVEESVDTVFITGTQHRRGWWADAPRVEFIECDFKYDHSVDALLKAIDEQGIDILINNAGVFTNTLIQNSELCHFTEIMDINLRSAWRLIQGCITHMGSLGWGRIVNISSIASIVSRPGMTAYSTSKAALEGLTRSAAIELADRGILVNAVCPAYVETDMLKALDDTARQQLLDKIPLNRFGAVSDIASQVAMLASNQNQFITGQSIVIDGGATIQ